MSFWGRTTMRRAVRSPWNAPSTVMIAGMLAFLAAKPGQAAEGGIALVPGALPNYVGVGVGVANDYIGSADLAPGGLPLARMSWENRYITGEGHYLRSERRRGGQEEGSQE